MIPHGVISIENSAFAFCQSLTNCTIPNSVKSIGSYAFFDCRSLPSITIPNSVTDIGLVAFRDCTNLSNVTLSGGVTSIGYGAFWNCMSLTSITIPHSVTNIGSYAFAFSTNLAEVYFKGNAPTNGWTEFDWGVFWGNYNVKIYYLPGAAGWGPTMFGGRPTALWKPQIRTSDPSFGVRTNQFGFNINWASGQSIVVEASTNLANPFWSPLQTNTLSGDSFYFSDPEWTNYPSRFYRLRWP